MSIAEVPATAQTRAQTQKISWLEWAILVSVATLFLLPFMRLVIAQSDEGWLLCGAIRIVQGQVFARDFFELAGPGGFYLVALFFKLFGSSFLVARLYLLFLLLGTAIAIFYLSSRLCSHRRWLPCVLLSGTYFGMIGQSVSHHMESNLFALLATICMINWRSSRRNALLIAAGCLAGITSCILQQKGVSLVCAFAVLLWFCRKQNKRLFATFFLLAGGYVGVIVIPLVYFWSQGALARLIYANYLFPAQHYEAVARVPYGLSLVKSTFWSYWVSLFHGSMAAKIVAGVLVLPNLFIATLPFLLLVFGFRFKWRSADPDALLLWLSGYAVWLAEMQRSDIYHLVWGAPLLVVLFTLLLDKNRSRLTDAAVSILYISGSCLAIANLLLAVLVAKPIPIRAGTITVVQSEFADVLKFLDQHVGRDEPILVYPYSPEYYFLSETTNPTPYSLLMYGYNTSDQFEEAVHVLDERRVKYVVWDTNFIAKSEKLVFPDAPQIDPKALIMEPYLESHYREVFQESGIRIMERLNGESSAEKSGLSSSNSMAASY